MTKKYRVHDLVKYDYSQIKQYIGEGYTDKPLRNDEIVDLLNSLSDENEQLKQQLLYDGDDVCSICKHQYLVPSGDYFIGTCKKGHKECSKEDIKYCEDFE